MGPSLISNCADWVFALGKNSLYKSTKICVQKFSWETKIAVQKVYISIHKGLDNCEQKNK